MKRNVEKYDYQVLNDAKNILMEIDMPKELYNPRCVMIFCACAQMIDGKSWRHISEEYMSVHDIIKYVNDVFPNKAGLDKKGYQENSRETFRDETLKRWVSAAIIESKAGLAANDRNNGYRFTSAFAALVRTYGSDQWEDSLSAFMETYESYSKKLKQVKSLPKGYDVTCGNITVKLGLSAHNKLQKQILEEFVPNFASGSELLYIGDTSDRTLQRDDKRLSELGIKILEDTSKLPDIILYDADKNRIIYVSATSKVSDPEDNSWLEIQPDKYHNRPYVLEVMSKGECFGRLGQISKMDKKIVSKLIAHPRKNPYSLAVDKKALRKDYHIFIIISSDMKILRNEDKMTAVDEILQIYETLTINQKQLVLHELLKKEENG